MQVRRRVLFAGAAKLAAAAGSVYNDLRHGLEATAHARASVHRVNNHADIVTTLDCTRTTDPYTRLSLSRLTLSYTSSFIENLHDRRSPAFYATKIKSLFSDTR